eukprot:GEMP01000475.1.p1 GENE.GEMP01000475.1~~GEMP01000475.1.p1  ORF type:complete len:824 (+),score=183.22 GEMP01000475.1:120-2591(+)
MNGSAQEAYVMNKNEVDHPICVANGTTDAWNGGKGNELGTNEAENAVKGKGANEAGNAGKGTRRGQNTGAQSVARVPWKGDWSCPSCDFLNFARNNTCKGRYECNTPKPEKKTQKVVSQADYNVHDWKCENCGDVVFKRRITCRKCQTPIRLTAGYVAAVSPSPPAQANDFSPRTSSIESSESTRVPASDDKSAEDASESRDATITSQRPVPEMRTEETHVGDARVKPVYNRVAPVMPRWVGKEKASHNFLVSTQQRIVDEKHHKHGMEAPRCVTEENRHTKYSLVGSQEWAAKVGQSAEAPRRIGEENKRKELNGGLLETASLPPWEIDHNEWRKKQNADVAQRVANRNKYNKQSNNVLQGSLEQNAHNVHNALTQQCQAVQNLHDGQLPDASTSWCMIPTNTQDAHRGTAAAHYQVIDETMRNAHSAMAATHPWVTDDQTCNSNISTANQWPWPVEENAHEKRSVDTRKWLAGEKNSIKNVPTLQWLAGEDKPGRHTEEVARFPVVENVHTKHYLESGKGALCDNAHNKERLEASKRAVADETFNNHCWEASKCAFGDKDSVRGTNGAADNNMLLTVAGERRNEACRAVGDDIVRNNRANVTRWTNEDAPALNPQQSVPLRRSPPDAPFISPIASTSMKANPALVVKAGEKGKTVTTAATRTASTKYLHIEFDGDVPDEESLKRTFEKCGDIVWVKILTHGNAIASSGVEKASKINVIIGSVQFCKPEGVENALKKYPRVTGKLLPTIKYVPDVLVDESRETTSWSNDAISSNHAAMSTYHAAMWSSGNMCGANGAGWGNHETWLYDWYHHMPKDEGVHSI